MIRAIVALGKWLDARFPEKVTVTKCLYDDLNSRFSATEKCLLNLANRNDVNVSKIMALEASIAAIKDAMTKAPTMAAQVRADYIRSGRMPE